MSGEELREQMVFILKVAPPLLLVPHRLSPL